MNIAQESLGPEEDPLLEKVPHIEGYRVLGSVVLLQRVGAGGMGIVYRGWHLTFRVEVAVKVLKPSLATDPEYVVRFRREAEAALKITHQNVVRVYDVGEKHGLHFIVMEFVRGETVRVRVRRWGKMRQGEAVTMLAAVAAGLAEAHSHGIVHRDIKPENILLSRTGRVKLADLGLVRQAYGSDGKSLVGGSSLILGTPQYMSPEQWDTPDVRPSADVWALGAVLYYLLTGEHGIPQLPMLKMARLVQEHDFPTLRVLPDLKPELHGVFEKCVARDAKARYQNAGDLLRDLVALGLQDQALLKEEGYRRAGPEPVEDWHVPTEAEVEAIEAQLAQPYVGIGINAPKRSQRSRGRYRSASSVTAVVVALLLLTMAATIVVQRQWLHSKETQAAEAIPPHETVPVKVDRKSDFQKDWPTSLLFDPPVPPHGDWVVSGELKITVARAVPYVREWLVVVAGLDGDMVVARERILVGQTVPFPLPPGRYRVRIYPNTDGGAFEVVIPDVAVVRSKPGIVIPSPVEGPQPRVSQPRGLRVCWLPPLISGYEPKEFKVGLSILADDGLESVHIDEQLVSTTQDNDQFQCSIAITPEQAVRGVCVRVVDKKQRKEVFTTLPIDAALDHDIDGPAGIKMKRIPVGDGVNMAWSGMSIRMQQKHWVAETETSVQQWLAMAMPEPGRVAAADHPVTNVSWMQATDFCRRLTEHARARGQLPDGYRYWLLDEVAFEFARRGLAQGVAAPLAAVRTGLAPGPVRSGAPNAFGLFNMDDNVSELCADDMFSFPIKPQAAMRDLEAHMIGTDWRGVRGANWATPPGSPRDYLVDRLDKKSGCRPSVGFRVALVPPSAYRDVESPQKQ